MVIYCDDCPDCLTDYSGKIAGEDDYDEADLRALGFAGVAIAAICGAYSARLVLASDGIYLAESGGEKVTSGATQRSHQGQDKWWRSQLQKRGLSAEDGRQLHDEGISSRYGYTDEEIEAEMDRLAKENYGNGEDDGE